MTPSEMGRKGGKARGKLLRAGKLPITGAATPKPTACTKCGEVLPTATEARLHCRKPRSKETQ